MIYQKLMLVGLLASAAPSALYADTTIIKGATIVQAAPELTRSPNSYIIIEDDRIIHIGQGEPTGKYTNLDLENAKIINADGKYIIPGLIDSHVHLASRPGIPWGNSPENLELLSSYYEQSVKSYLYYGYTTVIDLNVGGREHLAEFKKLSVSPNIYDCDAAAPVAEGYPLRFYPEAIRYTANRNFIYNEGQEELIPEDVNLTEHTPKAVVTRAKANGAVCFKTFHEAGWRPGSNWPVPNKKTLTTLKNQTQEAGIPLLIHANREANQKATYEYADILVHGMWHWDYINGEIATEPSESAFELAGKIASTRTGYMPTFQVLPGEGVLFDHSVLDDPELTNAYPAKLIEWYKTPAARWYRDQILGDEAPTKENLQTRYTNNIYKTEQSYRIAKHIYDQGGLLLFGTDTPSDQTYGNPPGLNGLWEMRHWQAAGIPLTAILKAATWDNAKAFNLEDDVGSISKGKIADILILEKDPTKSIEAFNSIQTVISRGKVIKRQSLSAKNL